jgi:hypothetical protein
MENIILKDGKVYEVQETELDVQALENQLADMQFGIQQQQQNCNDLQAKIDYIKSLQE